MHSVDRKDLRLRLGEHDFDDDDELFPYEERGVKFKMVHPRYVHWRKEYDLAMLHFDRPVTFRLHIQPVHLPDLNESFQGEMATVTGWGRLNSCMYMKMQHIKL